MKKIKIGVIDSGYDNSHTIKNNSLIFVRNGFGLEEFSDKTGHGTCVTKIIDNSCKDCEIFVIKYFGNLNEGTKKRLFTAIDIAASLELDSKAALYKQLQKLKDGALRCLFPAFNRKLKNNLFNAKYQLIACELLFVR